MKHRKISLSNNSSQYALSIRYNSLTNLPSHNLQTYTRKALFLLLSPRRTKERKRRSHLAHATKPFENTLDRPVYHNSVANVELFVSRKKSTCAVYEISKRVTFCAVPIRSSARLGSTRPASARACTGSAAVDIVGLIWRSGINQRANILAGSR